MEMTLKGGLKGVDVNKCTNYKDPKDPDTLISELSVSEAKELMENGVIVEENDSKSFFKLFILRL